MKKADLQIMCWIIRNIRFNPYVTSLEDHKIKLNICLRFDENENLIEFIREGYVYLQPWHIILALHSPSIVIKDHTGKKKFKRIFSKPYTKNMTMKKMIKFLQLQPNFWGFWKYMVREAGIEPT
jgi:hypothetical protein